MTEDALRGMSEDDPAAELVALLDSVPLDEIAPAPVFEASWPVFEAGGE
jgi:hypothetical protein